MIRKTHVSGFHPNTLVRYIFLYIMNETNNAWITCWLATQFDIVEMCSRIHRLWLGYDFYQQIVVNMYFRRDPFADLCLFPFSFEISLV